ncbi:MAG: tetratricopeptide repeat protein [Myxococcota bacterium]
MIALVVHLLAALTGCFDSSSVLATCDNGDVVACYKDGLAKANAPRPQFTDARKHFVQACMPTYREGSRPKENHPPACYALGKLVRDAKGGPTDLPRAVEMFSIACRSGIQAACVDHGLLVYAPDASAGIRAEPERAVEFFFNACNSVDLHTLPENGGADPNARACAALGRAYVDGKGVEDGRADLARAEQMYRKACDARYAPGCASVGDLLVKKSRTLVEATELYTQACKIDARHGCFELAQMHEKARFKGADIELAVDYYRKTCTIDPTRGCFEAASLLEQGKVIPREGEVESLYNLACEYGNEQACAKRSPGR